MQRMNDKTIWMLAAGLTAVTVIAACGGDESRNRKAIRGGGDGKTAGTPAAAQPGGGGVKKVNPSDPNITGIISFEGTPPVPEAIDMGANPECSKVAKETVYKEDLVVNNGKVRYAFLYLDISDTYEPPAEPALLDQIGCHYVPHIIGVQPGQKFQVKSSDPTLHNVHYIAKENGEDNFGMTKPGVRDVSEVFKVPEPTMVKIKCDVHPWMGAWLGVKSHPFFAVSGADGSYTIKNVPPGTYKLVLHHERTNLGGDQRVDVTVEAGKNATANFTLKQN